jgi:hypothetical protein
MRKIPQAPRYCRKSEIDILRGVSLSYPYLLFIFIYVNQDSSVGIATRYGLDDPRIESR